MDFSMQTDTSSAEQEDLELQQQQERLALQRKQLRSSQLGQPQSYQYQQPQRRVAKPRPSTILKELLEDTQETAEQQGVTATIRTQLEGKITLLRSDYQAGLWTGEYTKAFKKYMVKEYEKLQAEQDPGKKDANNAEFKTYLELLMKETYRGQPTPIAQVADEVHYYYLSKEELGKRIKKVSDSDGGIAKTFEELRNQKHSHTKSLRDQVAASYGLVRQLYTHAGKLPQRVQALSAQAQAAISAAQTWTLDGINMTLRQNDFSGVDADDKEVARINMQNLYGLITTLYNNQPVLEQLKQSEQSRDNLITTVYSALKFIPNVDVTLSFVALKRSLLVSLLFIQFRDILDASPEHKNITFIQDKYLYLKISDDLAEEIAAMVARFKFAKILIATMYRKRIRAFINFLTNFQSPMYGQYLNNPSVVAAIQAAVNEARANKKDTGYFGMLETKLGEIRFWTLTGAQQPQQ